MAGSKVKKIICNSCGAEFEDTLPECPYCGTMNYKGAEMEYFGRLEEVRSDMEQLGSVPEQETRSELKKQRKWILKLVLLLAVAAVLLFLGMEGVQILRSTGFQGRLCMAEGKFSYSGSAV